MKNTLSEYWAVKGENPNDAVKKLKAYKKDELVALVFNNRLNNFVAEYADFSDEEEERCMRGKRIPYIGWYWRYTDWYNLKIKIGCCGDFIGVMENNKWGCRERYLTEQEAKKVLDIVWQAKILSEKGGSPGEIEKSTKEKLEKLWPLFQTFSI